jgi:hypothetical protein
MLFSFPGNRVFRSTNYLPCHWGGETFAILNLIWSRLVKFLILFSLSHSLPIWFDLNNDNSLFRGDVTSSNNNESAIFRRWKSNLKWRMFHRLNVGKADCLLHFALYIVKLSVLVTLVRVCFLVLQVKFPSMWKSYCTEVNCKFWNIHDTVMIRIRKRQSK